MLIVVRYLPVDLRSICVGSKVLDDRVGGMVKRRAFVRSPFFMLVNCSQVACKSFVNYWLRGFDCVEHVCECWVVFEPIIEVFWFNVCVFCSFRYVVGLFVEL